MVKTSERIIALQKNLFQVVLKELEEREMQRKTKAEQEILVEEMDDEDRTALEYQNVDDSTVLSLDIIKT